MNCAPACRDHFATLPSARTRPVVHDHASSSGVDLVDQVGRPQHRHALVAAQLVHVFDDAAAGWAHRGRPSARPAAAASGRCRSARASSTRRRWPPFKLARRVPDAGSSRSSRSSSAVDALLAARAAEAVQRGEVEQVLLHGQVEVERRLLEHDADMRRAPARVRGAGPLRRPRSCRRRFEQPCDQREQRRLAGAVRAEQSGELACSDVEGHAFQREPTGVAKAEFVYGK